uniref:Solute carrier family 2, facilitated glucose transporter member 5-like n=1 Tax=Pogona vitticeps TaxID=103695 RepID=A0A6J0V655_9SAUR
MAGQQLSGINAAYYYTERIYMSTKVGADNVRYIAIASTAVLCISISLAVTLADSMGRRFLLLIGFGICSIICILITMTLEMQDTIPEMTYVSTILVDTFLFGHTLGPGPVPPVLTVELFLQSARSSAFVIAGFLQWLLNFFTGVSFYYIETRIGPYSFLIFWPICVATFSYVFKMVPETKDRTFLDVRRIMAIHTARKIQVQAPAGK